MSGKFAIDQQPNEKFLMDRSAASNFNNPD